MLAFNHYGHLVPNKNIKSDLQEFEREFVDKINNSKRSELFTKYSHYSSSLKAILNEQPLLQWIDGSFVTKKATPDDIDLVTFIDDISINLLGTAIEQFKYPFSMEIYGVDAYLVKVYRAEDKRYTLYIGDSMYWMSSFDKTYGGRNRQKLPKGFLEIIY